MFFNNILSIGRDYNPRSFTGFESDSSNETLQVLLITIIVYSKRAISLCIILKRMFFCY